MQRSMITTGAQFTSYDGFKAFCLNDLQMKDALPMHITASLMSSVVVASVASPMDVVRTRMLNSKSTPASVEVAAHSGSVLGRAAAAATAVFIAPPTVSAYAYAYTGTWDCMRQTFIKEGPRGFYKVRE
jgi:hypothetical protein